MLLRCFKALDPALYSSAVLMILGRCHHPPQPCFLSVDLRHNGLTVVPLPMQCDAPRILHRGESQERPKQWSTMKIMIKLLQTCRADQRIYLIQISESINVQPHVYIPIKIMYIEFRSRHQTNPTALTTMPASSYMCEPSSKLPKLH